MDFLWAFFFTLLLLLAQTLNIFSLPGNWLMACIAACWVWIGPASEMTWNFVFLILGIALVGEAVEWIAQAWGAKKYGASGRGNFGSILGAIAGAIFGAPFLFGIGALLGALLGAYLGCFLLELTKGRPQHEAHRASMGAFLGKSLGLTVKLSLGLTMFVLCLPKIW